MCSRIYRWNQTDPCLQPRTHCWHRAPAHRRESVSKSQFSSPSPEPALSPSVAFPWRSAEWPPAPTASQSDQISPAVPPSPAVAWAGPRVVAGLSAAGLAHFAATVGAQRTNAVLEATPLTSGAPPDSRSATLAPGVSPTGGSPRTRMRCCVCPSHQFRAASVAGEPGDRGH